MALNIEDINTNKSTSATTLLISVDAQGAGAGTLALITHVSCYPVGNTPTGVWYYPEDMAKLGDISYLTSINSSLWWEFGVDEWTNNCEVYFDSGTECAAGCIMVSGADPTTTVRDYAEGIDDSSPFQLADTGLTAGDMRISAMACYNTSSGAHTPADDEAWDADATGDYANSVGQYATLTGTSYTSSWTSTDPNNFALQAISLIPAGSGGIEALTSVVKTGTRTVIKLGVTKSPKLLVKDASQNIDKLGLTNGLKKLVKSSSMLTSTPALTNGLASPIKTTENVKAVEWILQPLQPASDDDQGDWLASDGQDLYAMVDENVPSDTDYIYLES